MLRGNRQWNNYGETKNIQEIFYREFPGGPVARTRVQSLVGELRFCKLHGAAKKRKEKERKKERKKSTVLAILDPNSMA